MGSPCLVEISPIRNHTPSMSRCHWSCDIRDGRTMAENLRA